MSQTLFNLTGDQLSNIITTAFRKGESWGVIYSTWFTPTMDQTADQIQKAEIEIVAEILKGYKKQNNEIK